MTLGDNGSEAESWVEDREGNGVTNSPDTSPSANPRWLSPPQRREAGPTVVSSSQSPLENEDIYALEARLQSTVYCTIPLFKKSQKYSSTI